MKASEALLLSIGAVGNYTKTWYDVSSPPGCINGCAITTMLHSVGDTYAAYTGGSTALHKHWPWTAEPVSSIPGYDKDDPTAISCEISYRHYNGESRESLAKWIATIEPQEEPTSTHLLEVEEQQVEVKA